MRFTLSAPRSAFFGGHRRTDEGKTARFGPRPQGALRVTMLDDDLPRIEQLVKERPDATLDELLAAPQALHPLPLPDPCAPPAIDA